jgi:hypothetical protein
MSKPAAFLGTYVDLKFLSGLKVARVTLEIPIERSQEFIGMFGTPNKADPAWCAIARMDVEALKAPTAPEKPPEPAPVEKAAGGEVGRKLTRSQKAALKCQDKDFDAWLRTECERRSPDYRYVMTADEALKALLGINSKRDLDTNGPCGDAFDRLLTSFEYRNQVRA